MINEVNNILWYKTNGLLRHFVARGMPSVLGSNLVVTEYPKSGGSWICQMLSDALEMKFPRNRLPSFTNTIIHGHYLNDLLMNRPVVVYRDGRDVMVSLYYYAMFVNEKNNARFVQKVRNVTQFSSPDDIRGNLPAFIKLTFENKITHFNWAEFVRNWSRKPRSLPVKYEDMIQDAPRELARLIYQITGDAPDDHRIRQVIDKYSFEAQSGRKRGNENPNSFLRKGIAGDWKNYFSNESLQAFNYYAKNELSLLGYEIVESR